MGIINTRIFNCKLWTENNLPSLNGIKAIDNRVYTWGRISHGTLLMFARATTYILTNKGESYVTVVLRNTGVGHRVYFNGVNYLFSNEKEMKKLKDLGFKKVRGTEPGFHMYELTPARLQAFDSHFKLQAASNKPQAPSGKQQALDKVK